MLKSGIIALAVLGADSSTIGENRLRGPVVASKVELPLSASAEARLKQVRPLTWVHAANSGAHFVNSLINLPNVCGTEHLSAEAEAMGSDDGSLIFHKNLNKHGHVPSRPEKRHEKHVKKRVNRREHRKEKEQQEEAALLELPPAVPGSLQDFVSRHQLKGSCHGLTRSYMWWTHQGFGRSYKENAGKGVIMMRQPEQRILSAWFHSGSLWKNFTLVEYAKRASGCVVKMLTRDHMAPCEDLSPPTKQEQLLAKKRLVEGFAFVGVAEKWTRSVGLFHKMFGGECRDFELLDDQADSLQEYDVKRLEGFVDEYDGELYNEARKIFTDNMERYEVSYTEPLAHCAPVTAPVTAK